MRATRILMGMPITVEIGGTRYGALAEQVFAHFESVDRRFSPFRADSEVAAINAGRLAEAEQSAEMRAVLALAERTRRESGGYFDIRRADGTIDPSGIVKGWAILGAAAIISRSGARDYYVDAGGDVQSSGLNGDGSPWRVGIRNPFDPGEIVKVLEPRGRGIATSGTYVRGEHIYDPHAPARPPAGLVSLTVLGPDVLEADRFATAAFAMGADGIEFIEAMPGLEGYAIDRHGEATLTSGLEEHCVPC